MQYETIKTNGITFVFKYEPGTDILHIFARHLMTPAAAIKVWFEGRPNGMNRTSDSTPATTASRSLGSG